jgi:hypothetical protein
MMIPVSYIYEGVIIMTESDFWMFLEISRAGRQMSMLSGYADSDNPVIQKANEYLGGHSVLFEGHDKLPISLVSDMGRLLLDRRISLRAKEAILVILAHHPTKEALGVLKKYDENPDKELRYTSRFALEECEWWNE